MEFWNHPSYNQARVLTAEKNATYGAYKELTANLSPVRDCALSKMFPFHAFLLLGTVVSLSTGSHRVHNSLHHRQNGGSSCALSILTNPWSTCLGLIQTYNLTIAEFAALNPSVGSDCGGFKPGTTYCADAGECCHSIDGFSNNRLTVTGGSALPISMDGTCGAQANWTNTWFGSFFGPCCSSSGWCGSMTYIQP